MSKRSGNVLIIGIDSFTGGYLERELLAAGYDVKGTVFGESPGENYYQCNVKDREQVAGVLQKTAPDYIIHLVAQSFIAHDDMREFYEVNLFGAINLLDAVLEGTDHGLPAKIILASTANVYGKTAYAVLDENVCPNPVNHYALSKYAMEKIAANYFDRLNIMITRPFNYTGVGQSDKFIIPKIVGHFLEKKEIIELGNMDSERDFSDVRDVVRAYRVIMESDLYSGIINICSSRTISISRILELARTYSHHDIKIAVNNSFKRRSDIRSLRGDNGKLRQLGYVSRYTIEDTIAWMLSGEKNAGDN